MNALACLCLRNLDLPLPGELGWVRMDTLSTAVPTSDILGCAVLRQLRICKPWTTDTQKQFPRAWEKARTMWEDRMWVGNVQERGKSELIARGRLSIGHRVPAGGGGEAETCHQHHGRPASWGADCLGPGKDKYLASCPGRGLPQRSCTELIDSSVLITNSTS